MDSLKYKQKASNNNKIGNLCRTQFLKPILKMVQQEMCCRKYINRNRVGNKMVLRIKQVKLILFASH